MTDAERLAMMLKDRSVPMATPTGEFIPTPPLNNTPQVSPYNPIGIGETILNLGTGAIATPIAGWYGAGTQLFGGDGKTAAGKLADALTYKPTTEYGQASTSAFGDFADRSGLSSLPPVVSGIPTPRLGAGATRFAAQQYGMPVLEKSLTMYEQGKLTPGFKPVSELTVYHGTPHEIAGNKFDISKVGTGEGAQSYGHGIYVAENPKVGKEYQKMLAGPDQTAADYLKMYKTPENAISVLQESITSNLTPEAKQFTQAAIDALKSGKSLIGNFYKADIPDEQIPKMLDWDQPIAKQTPEILTLLKNHPAILEDVAKGKTLEQLSGGDAYKAIASSFDVGQKEAYKLASEYLASQGVPGIKYLDQQSRTSNLSSSTRTQLDAKIETLQKDIASGLGNQELMKRQLANLEHERNQLPKATSNFVSFKPETIEILEKNDVPVSRKELLQQQFDSLNK